MVSKLTHRLVAIACATLLTTLIAERSMAQSGPANASELSPRVTSQSEISQPLTLSGALDLARKGHPELRVAAACPALPDEYPELFAQGRAGGSFY